MNIYVRLRGGLGNQMFQYAYAVAIQQRTPNSIVKLDVREYEYYRYRNLELTDFILSDTTQIAEERHLSYDSISKVHRVCQHFYKKVHGDYTTKVNPFLYKRGLILGGVSSLILDVRLPENVYIYGYFQAAEPILPVRGILIQNLSLNESKIGKVQHYLEMITDKSIALSIRLGPDVKMNGWKQYDANYYKRAITYIREQHQVNQLVIMSDEVERVVEERWFEGLGLDIVYIKECSPAQQIEVMKVCRDFVISNSTFAWWGAFLGSYKKDSIIVAPYVWQANTPMKETALMLDNIVVID